MTLQNGFITQNEARLYTDTAWLAPDSKAVYAFYPKGFVSQSELFPYAVTVVRHGPALAMDPMRDVCEHFERARPWTTDDLVECASGFVRQMSQRGDTIVRLLVASFEDRPRLHLVASDEFPYAKACEPVELVSYASSGNSTGPYFAAVEKGFNRSRMLDLVDAQRAEMLSGAADGTSAYGIGGECIEITVSSAGASQTIVRAWSDKLDMPIDPRRDEVIHS